MGWHLMPYSNIGLDRFKAGDLVHITMVHYLARDQWDYQYKNNTILSVTPCYVRYRTPEGHETRVRRCNIHSITPAENRVAAMSTNII